MKNKKRNYLTKVVAIMLTCILFITGIRIENVSAFWNVTDKNAYREFAEITIQLIHCYHNDTSDPLYSTHYDSSGRHKLDAVQADLDSWKSDKKNNPRGRTECVMTDTVQPRVLNDYKAGLESIDTNKYFYEYSLTYAESELVDYVLITQPEITHYSDNDSKRPADLREEHVRMYWIGSYNKSMTEVTGKWTENGYDENDTDIGWWDFENESFPTIDPSLSQQTWETVGDHEAFQNNKSFVFTKKMGENGMEFIYLLEGTKTVNANDGSFLDITGGIYDYLKSADALTVDKAERRYNKTYTSNGDPNTSADPVFNHRDQSHDGIPLGYGGHVNAVIGIVFYNTVDFDANSGTFGEGSVYRMQTYSNSKQGRLYSWYEDRSKRVWYSGIDVSNPQVSTQYGNVSVKAPTRPGYYFLGWYAPELDSSGNFIYKSDGTIKLSDVPVYDTDGRAVLTYTDSSGQTKASPYFDSNGRWIYKGNVTACAKWKYTGKYTLHYDKGESNNTGAVIPGDGSATLGKSITMADGSGIMGSDYTVDFITQTDCTGVISKAVAPIRDRFSFRGWDILGNICQGGQEFYKSDAVDGDICTATAIYGDFKDKLPEAACEGYELEGWYTAWDSAAKTFRPEDRAGSPGESYTVGTSGNSVYRTYYAHWLKSDFYISFNAYRCDDCNSPGTTKQAEISVSFGKYNSSASSVKTAGIDSLHGFTGWYDADGVQVYDSNGNAVLSSPYWTADSQGRAVWNYRDSLEVYAHYSEGYYTLHYDRGESNNTAGMPEDSSAPLGGSFNLADGGKCSGSDYLVSFDVNTESDTKNFATVPDAELGRFPFAYWSIEGQAYGGGGKNLTYSKPDAVHRETVTATAVYSDVTVTLPATSRTGYVFKGWYTEKECVNFAGSAGDTVTIRTSADSVYIPYYAKWEKGYITVALDYNVPVKAKQSRLGYKLGGNELSSVKVQYFMPLGGLPHPTLTGYALSVSDISDGWSASPNLSDGTQVNTPVNKDTVYDGSYDTLYAQWSPVYYTLRYDLGGGSVTQKNPYDANYYQQITVYSPTRDGSTFLGWSITGMDGNNHIVDGELTGTGLTSCSGAGKNKTSIDITGLRADSGTVWLTAVWQDTDYSIAYDYRDAETGAGLTPVTDPGNPSRYNRNTPTFTLSTPEVKGYYTPLWGGTGITGTIPSVVIEQGSTGNRRYTAYFHPAEYEIVYDLSGGSWGAGADHPDSAKYNRSFTVSNPVMEGCDFAGWEITGMCDDCDHKAGNSIITGTGASGVRETSFMSLRCNSAEKVLFTAKWSHVVYDIRYELNGGSFYSGGSYPASAETYTVFDINNPVRNGYTFAGWTISGMDNGRHYLPSGDTYAETKSGVGTGRADGMALSYGYLRYSAGTVTFKAAWMHDSRQLAFFGNGGAMTDGSMKDVTDDWTLRFINFGSTAFFGKYEYDTVWGTDVPAVSKTGYTFTGYYDSLSGGNRVYGSTYVKEPGLYWDDDSRWIGPSLILYAQFIPNSYTVTFNTNGGYWSSDNGQGNRVLGVTYDSTKNNKAYGQTDLYRPGYTFTGWGTNPDGTGYAVYDIDGYNTDEGGYWSEDYRK